MSPAERDKTEGDRARPGDRNLFDGGGGIERPERERLLGRRGCVLWFTGLSGSGKSTLAQAVERRLVESGRHAFVLDGDRIRQGLNNDLGFSAADREENIRRVGEVAALFSEAGVVAIVAFISPYRQDRRRARETAGGDRFVEIFLDVPLEVCERRDPKGHYRRARAGEIADFTGVSAPYEAPEAPDVVIDTGSTGIEESVAIVLAHLSARERESRP